jgi:DNA adenine methylase
MSSEATPFDSSHSEQRMCGPILKWAGGKTQLLPTLANHYPPELSRGLVDTYIEPFIGGGAVFFDITNTFRYKHAVLLDVNPELVIVYNSVKSDVGRVIQALEELEREYISRTGDGRATFFYQMRDLFNGGIEQARRTAGRSAVDPERTALTIFLNRTCFNGLFRVNRHGSFNVPHGRYTQPSILMKERLNAASSALQRATIIQGDFELSARFISGMTFIYYDPPYRPVSNTSHFTSYAKEAFDDAEQIRLSQSYRHLSDQGVQQLLSNSDPTNYIEDPFFDELYRGFSIYRIEARRMINSNSSRRGALREILVRNY